MQASRMKNYALAVSLSLSFAFAYRSVAPEAAVAARTAAPPRAHPAARGTVLYGRNVARFAGFALDITFTPDGRLLCVEVASGARGEARDGRAE